MNDLDTMSRRSLAQVPGRRIKPIAAILLVALASAGTVRGADPGAADAMRAFVSDQALAGYFPLASPTAAADVFVAAADWKVAHIAAAALAAEERHGLGPKTYARVFELMLRLNANHVWPAMHDGDGGTIPFNCYENNKEHIYKYWEDRVKANGKYENVYTMGKRGKDDEAGSDVTVPVLERIIADQRTILGQWVDQDLTRVPQVLIAYTEVLGLYNKGLKVPDDLILCWPDDNFGYIRQLPDAREQKRAGGSGVYYHIQWLNGATTAYPWLNTTPRALIWEEMSKAWQYGAKNLWVLNVGDIKPGEIGTEFFLELAWDPQRYRHDNVREFLVRWAARDLDPRFADEIASIMEEYYRLGLARRPEHLVQAKGKNPLQYSWFSHTLANDGPQSLRIAIHIRK